MVLNFNRNKKVEKEFIIIEMEIFILETERMIFLMEKELIYLRTGKDL